MKNIGTGSFADPDIFFGNDTVSCAITKHLHRRIFAGGEKVNKNKEKKRKKKNEENFLCFYYNRLSG